MSARYSPGTGAVRERPGTPDLYCGPRDLRVWGGVRPEAWQLANTSIPTSVVLWEVRMASSCMAR